jgi:hypothetical protein
MRFRNLQLLKATYPCSLLVHKEEGQVPQTPQSKVLNKEDPINTAVWILLEVLTSPFLFYLKLKRLQSNFSDSLCLYAMPKY